VRIEATCCHCGRDFLLFQLYNTSPDLADRCPHCYKHLGIPGVARLAAEADRSLTRLATAVARIAEVPERSFTIKPASVTEPLEQPLASGSRPPTRAA
jgi:hypothetical protein